MTTLVAPIKYHGGKHYLAKRIVALMPPHTHFVEPYFGGGSVLLAKDPDKVSEVVNDIDGHLTHFWRVLQGEQSFERFRRVVEAVPFSEPEWDDADQPQTDPILRAVSWFIRCRQSLAGRGDSFAPLSRTRTRRDMNEQASAWLSAVEGLPAVHERLKRVVILNRDALDVIRQQDGAGTLFYLDPPYLPQTRTAPDVYRHEMSGDDHVKLLKTLSRIKGQFILSGYDNQLYSRAAEKWGWHCRRFETANHAAGGAEKRRMIEGVWTNYSPHEG